MDYGPLKELLQARLTAAQLQEIAITAEIKALEDQLDVLATVEGGSPSATWEIRNAPTHNVAILSVLLNSQDPMSPQEIRQAIEDAGREPPSQISFYVDQLYKKEAIRRVARGQYRPGTFNAMTKPFFPVGYTG